MARSSDVPTLLARARSGDRRSLARLISLVERGDADGESVLAAVFSATGRAWTTGLTGAPGAGKSTLTDQLIRTIRLDGCEVAILAVDPSSPFSGGAILGDRLRMQDHVDDAGVYIRSMASRGHLGGIAEATPRALTVLDGVGFPEVLVETVGVGQAEVDIAGQADTTLVVLNPRWGDSIQAAKAGLLEIGDVFVVNKADRPGVDDTVRDLRQMLELGGERTWWPPIVTTVATDGDGTDEVWSAVQSHRRHLTETGSLAEVRRSRLTSEVREAVGFAMRRAVRSRLDQTAWSQLIDDVTSRKLDPWTAARQITALLDAG
ncbi:MAG TPA: methylmalonyl Co-A mutase-associated GTPase MeaB [Acidimicrobiia bacterium]|jgi:LAO/AO transport system kinase|nr:methylmalonyl Co-A mutase-associated GTPase MeaB [Acidimicrobiia bacterium]